MLLAIALFLGQVENTTLTFQPDKEPAKGQLDQVIKIVGERFIAYGYKDLTIAKDGNLLVVKRKAGVFDNTMTKAIERLLKLTGQKVELRKLYRMTPAEIDQYRPETKIDGSFGNAPPNTKWHRIIKPDLTVEEGVYAIQDEPVVKFSDLAKFIEKNNAYPINYRPNKAALAALSKLDQRGEDPFLRILIDGYVVEDLYVGYLFNNDGKGGREPTLWLQAKQMTGMRDYPVVPLVVMENPLPFILSLKEAK